LECYDRALAQNLEGWFQNKIRQSRQVTLEQVDSRRLALRLRDGAARLLSPYL
jgi:cardiolipin synthase